MAHISHKHIENQGVLYVVATPIGNFADMTERAVKVLSDVDLILAEDTRRTKPLLQRFAIAASKIMSFHEHNEERLSQSVIEKMLSGASVALVSCGWFTNGSIFLCRVFAGKINATNSSVEDFAGSARYFDFL